MNKDKQKQNLIDMMQDDEKLGLYDESLEEAKDTAWNIYEHVEGHLYSTSFKNGFEAGAKWQAERMYSEEEVEDIAWRAWYESQFQKPENKDEEGFNEWFKTFKKK